jgi:predicted phosphate transport protein (TIGR00153 family)
MAGGGGGRRLRSLRLIPREERFFDLFVEDAANVLDGARLLEAMLRDFDNPDKAAKKIREVEHRGDDISHDIGRRLERTFVTPFDREEIHALISGLDDILDDIEQVADTFVLYRIESPTKNSVKQASLIVQACETIHAALSHLKGFKELDGYISEIHRLENEGDRLSRNAIAGLFDDGAKTIEVLKWKDVYALLEDTIDKCEDVADLIERIVVKHA